MGGASVALALTRADPRSPRRGGTESRSLPPLWAVTQPRSCRRVPARGGKCEAPLRAPAKPNSPPPQTLSHWRIRGAIGRSGGGASSRHGALPLGWGAPARARAIRSGFSDRPCPPWVPRLVTTPGFLLGPAGQIPAAEGPARRGPGRAFPLPPPAVEVALVWGAAVPGARRPRQMRQCLGEGAASGGEGHGRGDGGRACVPGRADLGAPRAPEGRASCWAPALRHRDKRTAPGARGSRRPHLCGLRPMSRWARLGSFRAEMPFPARFSTALVPPESPSATLPRSFSPSGPHVSLPRSEVGGSGGRGIPT